MLLIKRELPVFLFNLVYIPVFTAIAWGGKNYEFLLYVGVILIVGGLILAKQRTVRFDLTILWGISLWGLIHMAGGNLRVGDDVLYGLVLVPLIPSYDILRYDQVVHAFGFGVSTLIAHHLLRPYLREGITRWGALSVLIVLMGCGFGAINEVIEFIAVVVMPETGVGGYTNTALDLVFNLLGAIGAVMFLSWRRRSEVVIDEPA